MKKIIYLSIVLISLIAITLLVLLYEYNSEAEDSIFFVVQKHGNEYRINYWYDETNDIYYVFLPTFAELENIEVNTNRKHVRIGSYSYEDRRVIRDIDLNTKYEFVIQDRNEEILINSNIKFMQSSNMATLFINTYTGTMEHIHADQEHRESASIKLVNMDGTLDYAGRIQHITGRGNTSWGEVKKGYGMNLLYDVDLLGMGAGTTWALVANYVDRTHMRNKLIFNFADNIGLEFTPNLRFVDLYLNNEFVGLYLLKERIEIAPNRVDINDGSIHDLTGGYILELQHHRRWYQVENGFITSKNRHIAIRRPRSVTNEQINYIANRWQALEDALYDIEDQYTWMQYIDVTSWAKKYMLEELFGNADSSVSSQFFYKDFDSVDLLFYAGPVWDYDKTLGVVYIRRMPDRIFHDERFWAPLLEKEYFVTTMTFLWYDVFLPEVEEILENEIDRLADEIYDAVQMNIIRWGHTQAGERDYLILYPGFEQNIEHLRNFLTRRVEFFGNEWGSTRQQ